MAHRPVGPSGYTAEEIVGWNYPANNRSLKAKALETHHFHPIRCFGADGDALLACLETDGMRSAFQRYDKWDRSSIDAQKRYKWRSRWIVFPTIVALVLCLLMLIPPEATANGIAAFLGGGGQLAASLEDGIRHYSPLAVFVLLLLTPALELGWRPQRDYLKWRQDRASAEAMRRRIFTHLMRTRPQPGTHGQPRVWDPAWLLQLKLEYFRRWQVEVQHAYFLNRPKDLRKQTHHARIAKGLYAVVLGAFGLVLLASLVSSHDEQGVVFAGGASAVATPIMSLLSSAEIVHGDYWLLLVIGLTLLVGVWTKYGESLASALRDATRYETMKANFDEVLGDRGQGVRLARAREAAVANNEEGVLDYVNTVHAMMSLESNDWVRLGQIEWGLADQGLRRDAPAA